MRKLLLTLTTMGCIFSFAQVGINTDSPHPSSILDMSTNEKGFLAPRVSLLNDRDTTTINSPKKGLLVFNLTENASLSPGYYYYNNEKWEPFYNTTNEVLVGVSENVYASMLGYVPSGFSENSLAEISYYGATSIKRECFEFTDSHSGAQPHTYCGYTMTDSVTWEQAFEFAKYQKGYLATITSENEWNAIKDNLLSLGENANNNIWIGYNTIQTPGNVREYTWITGENSVINWSNSATLQAFYAANEPDGATGCVYISALATSTARNWYNDSCSTTTANGQPFNYIIVEFQN